MAFNLENYEDVDTRIHKFWDAYPDGRIVTDITHLGLSPEGRVVQVIVTAQIFGHLNELVPTATGIAEEMLGSSPVNKTSFIENCETSAIGRALANAGFSTKGARPSQTEMSKATRTKAPIEDDPWATKELQPHQKKWAYVGMDPANPAQLKMLHSVLAKLMPDATDAEKAEFIRVTVDREDLASTKDLRKGETSALIDVIQELGAA